MSRIIFLGIVFLVGFSTLHAGGREEICHLRETDGHWQVWVMNDKGGRAAQVTNSPVDKARCTWAGTSGDLLVTTVAGTIFRVDRDTRVEQPVEVDTRKLIDVASLPDGRGLLFSSPGAGIDTDDIWMFRFDDGELRRLTHEPYLEHFPVACPDGKRVIYVGGLGGNEHNVYRLDLDSVTNGPSERLTQQQLYNFEPSCSASGAIVFSSNRSGNYEIWKMDEDGSEPVQLTTDPSADGHPSWSPDERYVAFESTRDGAPAVYRLDLKKSRVRRLTPKGVLARSPVWRHR